MSDATYTLTERDFGVVAMPTANADWSFLGRFYGKDGPGRSELDLAAYRSKDVMFRFTAHGIQSLAPQITRFELEYLPVGPKYRYATATIMVADDLETLIINEVDHSNEFVRATLFSCAGSQLPYTIGLPAWPEPAPYTIRAQVFINAPGAQALVLNHDSKIEGEISIRFEEL